MTWTPPGYGRITSPYGPRRLAGAVSNFHAGTDLGTKRTAVYAASAGVVRSIWRTALGAWVVDVRHADEGGRQVRTRYIHLYRDEIDVQVGQRLAAGQRVGLSGASGTSAAHLHFEVLIDSVNVDPVPFMAARGVTLGAAQVSNPGPSRPTPPVVAPTPTPVPITPTSEEDNVLDTLTAIYLNTMGVMPDPAGASNWITAVACGDLTWDQVREKIQSQKPSQDFAALGSDQARDAKRNASAAAAGWPR